MLRGIVQGKVNKASMRTSLSAGGLQEVSVAAVVQVDRHWSKMVAARKTGIAASRSNAMHKARPDTKQEGQCKRIRTTLSKGWGKPSALQIQAMIFMAPIRCKSCIETALQPLEGKIFMSASLTQMAISWHGTLPASPTRSAIGLL